MKKACGMLVVAVVASACGAASRPEPIATPEADRDAAEMEALFLARTDSARMRFSEHDVRFVTGMIVHHSQALAMADLVPNRAADRSIHTLAARIINGQQDEIESMRQWLRERDQPVAEAGVMDHAAHADHADMPGMITAGQMRELEQARGVEFDRLFLRFMIEHHRGAVTMVRTLFATDGAAQDEAVFKLASDIQVDQITEVARMRLMLESLPG